MTETMLTGFTAGFLLIGISELGDKSFFIAMLLAMRYPRWLVFGGAIAALSLMTVISILMGQMIGLLPKNYTHWVAIGLMLFFGIKLLWDASQMPAHAEDQEVAAAAAVVEEAEAKLSKKASAGVIVLESAMLTFVTELGDRTQIATITLAATNHPLGLAIGAILGHALCTLIAVIGGCMVVGKISERMVTVFGGVLFLMFALGTWLEGS